MKSNYSKKILTVSIIVFLVILILNIISFNFLRIKIISLNDKVNQIDFSTQEREKELILKDLLADTEIEREKFSKYFIGAGNIETVKFTEYLEVLAKDIGVIEKKSLSNEPIFIDESDTAESFSIIRYKLNVSGRWSNIYNFVRAIENLPKIGYLNSISLNSISGPGAVKSWSADLDFSIVKLNN